MFRQLRLSSDSTRTKLGLARTQLRPSIDFFYGKLEGRWTVRGLSVDCPWTLRTVLGLHGLLGLSSESLQNGGCRVKYWFNVLNQENKNITGKDARCDYTLE